MPEPTVSLRLRGAGREDRLRAWVGALGRVAAGARVLHTEAPADPEALGAWCEASGVQLATVLDEPIQCDVLIVAEADDLPTAGALRRLVAATVDTSLAHETRMLPCGTTAPGSDAEPGRPPSACVAVPAPVADAVPAGAGPQEAIAVAESTGVSVRRLATAAVFRDGWPVSVATTPDAVDTPAYGHPAALPATPLHQLLVQTGLTPPELPHQRERPLLTVLTRTQGTRLLCLEETLTCLAGQSSRDFELVLACHRVSADGLVGVRRVLAEMPAWLQERARVLEVDRPGRSAPLNDALDVSRGRYAVVLDDDDVVAADWVSAFAQAEQHGPGTVLRSAALAQEVHPVILEEADGPAPVEAGPAHPVWSSEFSLVDHLWDNDSPPMSFAVPRGVFDDLGHRFDESLDTTEDWDFLVRAASVAGVTSTPAVTAVYRVWTGDEGSRHLHDKHQWASGRKAVLAAIDSRVVLLQPGEARAVRNLRQALIDETAEKFRFAGLNEQAARDLVSVNEAVVVLRARIADLEERLIRQRRRNKRSE